MSRKTIFTICLLSSLITSVVVSFLANRVIFFAYHQAEDFDCAAEIRLYIQPSTKTIKIGEDFTASIILEDYNCIETRKLSDNITWVAENSGVATVDAETGIVSGISTGETTIKAIGAIYRSLDGVRVVVTE